MPDLHALALELVRPVTRGWLRIAMAEAALLLVALRADADSDAAIALAKEAQSMLRQAVAA